MRGGESLRLLAVAVLLLVLQLAFYLRFPGMRAFIDLYIVFLLLLTAARGPLLGGAFAVFGGLVMDAFSGSYIAFHVFFYLVPVFTGTLIRSHMLAEYRMLGTLTVAVLLLFKVLAQFAVALALGWIDSPLYLLRVNYFGLILMMLLVFSGWGWLLRICGTVREVRGLHG